jgi:hypothetical protein
MEVNIQLAKKLVRDLIELPGGHVRYVTLPAEFFTRACAGSCAYV